jgi:predicted outer membrane protein
MKTIIPWILMSALGVFGLTNCSSDEDDDDNGGGSSGTSAGKGGTGGKGGSGGAGKGGSAGSAGKGGSAGSTGDAGEAGSLGTAGASAGAPGEGGAAGDLGTAGDGPGAGAGGVAGSDGGMAGAGGDDGADALTDARILHVMITLSTGEVAEGQLALTRATDPSVLSFADEMVMEHGAANTRANTLATEQAIIPETNSISEMLAQKSSETVVELTAVAAAEFDVAYMESQVTTHTEVLTLIEDQLLPEADNAELVTFLGDIRDHVEAHLFDAETTLEGL